MPDRTRRIFISHISEDAAVAARVKKVLVRDFLGLIEVFLSSDTESIAAGEEWLTSMKQALGDCSAVLVLCSPDSLTRPWINFEVGAAWMKNVPIIPVCHAGLSPRDLLMPLSLRQGIALSDGEGLKRMYGRLARILGANTPDRDYNALATELTSGMVARERTHPHLNENRDLRDRLYTSLRHPEHKWRSIDALATEAVVSMERVADVLRGDDTVRFSTGREGNTIVGLKSRVGEHRATRRKGESPAEQ
jgi:hypothetical protein